MKFKVIKSVSVRTGKSINSDVTGEKLLPGDEFDAKSVEAVRQNQYAELADGNFVIVKYGTTSYATEVQAKSADPDPVKEEETGKDVIPEDFKEVKEIESPAEEKVAEEAPAPVKTSKSKKSK